ncbi:signal peptide peptidase SppA [Rhodoferax sp.]|uniref:signal peptide peptidase SppA n=1 Tax=Rhodoferax sp. TaxID=50421 RepID=UPI0027641955|nr:signal peptide peptidase SppA [Rhodoferax sp.]
MTALFLRWPARIFRIIWRALDLGRRVLLNLLLLLLVVILVAAFFAGRPRALQDNTTLVLDLKGALVEQKSGSAGGSLLAQVRGESRAATRLRDVLLVLDAAAVDPKIGRVLLMPDDLGAAGLATLHEVAAALERFKASGKPVLAWGAGFDQRQYYLAAHASQVFLDPMGAVLLEGFGGYRNYYLDALDKLGVTAHVIRVGTFKSFAEPYIANQPSSAAAEADAFLYNGLWRTYTEAVERARKFEPGRVTQGIDQLPEALKAVGGDMARLALSSKLVDGLKTRDELRRLLIEQGAKDDEGKSFRQVGFEDYLHRQRPKTGGDTIGVVVAEGAITDGVAPMGGVGGLSTAALIRQAREDDKVKALVLRVNSPGGSAYGSELIRRELELTRAAGKPVVVSMGNVAASGGYWVAMSADEVIADAATVTGSIGVFAMLPTAEKLMDKLGVHSAGTTTTWLTGGYDPRRALDPRLAGVIQSSVNHIYADFTAKAALARKTTPQKIDDVAQGRVWTGQQAKERGLIDTVGGYQDAIQAAAKRAKLAGGYSVAYIERGPSSLDRLMSLLPGAAVDAVSDAVGARLAGELRPLALAKLPLGEVGADLGWLADVAKRRKPFEAMTHCLCGAP